jgi:hypothetical protein
MEIPFQSQTETKPLVFEIIKKTICFDSVIPEIILKRLNVFVLVKDNYFYGFIAIFIEDFDQKL